MLYTIAFVVAQTWSWIDDKEVSIPFEFEDWTLISGGLAAVVICAGPIIAGVIVLALTYWQYAIGLCGAIALSFTARGLRRLIKTVALHTADKNAHN